MKEEAEIASSAEYINEESVNSLINQTNLTMRVQIFRERRTNPRRRMILKNRVGRVTKSQAPLFVL